MTSTTGTQFKRAREQTPPPKQTTQQPDIGIAPSRDKSRPRALTPFVGAIIALGLLQGAWRAPAVVPNRWFWAVMFVCAVLPMVALVSTEDPKEKLETKTASFVVPTWLDCITRMIPIPDHLAWKALPVPKRLLVLIRAPVLHLTLISALIPFFFIQARVDLFSLWLLSILLWHASHNLINDFEDLRCGLDADKLSLRATYGTHPLGQGFISKRVFFQVCFALFGCALATSAILIFVHTSCWWVFAGGFAASLLYTPVFKVIGLGEVAVYFVWGPFMVGGGAAATSGATSFALLWGVSLPIGLGATAMLMGKHLDKIEESKKKQVCTLPVLLGAANARSCTQALFVCQHIVLIALVLCGWLPWQALVALMALRELKVIWPIFSHSKPTTCPDMEMTGWMMVHDPVTVWPLWYSGSAAVHVLTFGYLLLAGISLGSLLGSWQVPP